MSIPSLVGAAALLSTLSAASASAATCASWTDFVTGPGPALQVHIPSTTRNGGQRDCVLGLNNQGAGVFILQDALIRCYGQKIPQDAIYGPETVKSMKNVQTFHNVVGNRNPKLKVDGVYGPDTRAAMTFAKFLPNGEFSHCW